MVKQIIKEAMNQNPLGLKEAVEAELRARVALALEAKMEESVELEEAKASGTYAKVEYNYSDDFWHIEVVKDGKSVAKADGYIGANAVGNPLITKFVEMVKKAGLKPEGMKIVSDWEDYTEGVFKNNTFKWNKKSVKESLDEAKMTDAEVLSAAKALAANGKDEKTKAFGKGLVDFYKKEGSFTPAQVGGLQNIMKNASFQMAKDK
jgi:hypothetical protein